MKKQYIVEYSTENDAHESAGRMAWIIVVFMVFLAIVAFF